MKSTSAFRRVLSMLCAVTMLVSMLATVIVLPAAAATGYSDNYSVLADFSTTNPNDYGTSGNAAHTVESVSPSGYGAGLSWAKADSTLSYTALRMNWRASSSITQATDTAIAFWVSLADFGYNYAVNLRTIVYSANKALQGSTSAHSPYSGAPIYLIQDGVATEEAAVDQNVVLPGGFVGWVVVPYDSLQNHGEVQNTTDTVSPNFVTGLDLFYSVEGVTDGVIHLDEVGVTGDHMAFVRDMGQFAAGDGYTEDLNDLAAAADVNVEGATVSAASGALNVVAGAGASVSILSQPVNPISVETFKALSFWISADEAVTLTPSLTYASGAAALNVADLGRDFYRLIDTAADKVTVCAYENGAISIPAGFTGYVLFTAESFAADVALADLVSVDLTVADAATFTLDSLQASAGTNGFVTYTLGMEADTQYLLVVDGAKVSINDMFFTLNAADMTSAAFLNAVAVRSGYRVMYRNADNEQLFGAQTDMDDVAVIDVYLGATRVAVYYNANLPLNEDPTWGGATSPDEFNIVADMDSVEPLDIFHLGGGGVTVSNSDFSYSKVLSWTRGTAQDWDKTNNRAHVTSDMYISFCNTGYMDEEALVFWFSAEGMYFDNNKLSSGLDISMFAKTNGKGLVEFTMENGAPYYTLADGDAEMVEATAFVDDTNYAAHLTINKGFKGWYIIPLSSFSRYDMDEDIYINEETGEEIPYEDALAISRAKNLKAEYDKEVEENGSSSIVYDEALAAIEMKSIPVWYDATPDVGSARLLKMRTADTYGNILYVDEIGFTNDIDTFAAAAYANELSGAPQTTAAYLTTYIDFDEKLPASSKYALVNCVSPYGVAGRFNEVGLHPLHNNAGTNVGTSKDEALVMWVSNKDLPRTAVNMYLMNTGDANHAWIPASGEIFTMVSTDGVRSTDALQDGAIPVPADFEGWVVVPFTGFTPHGGYGSTPEEVIPGGYDYIYNATLNSIVFDQIGFTNNIEKFIGSVEGVENKVTHNWVDGVCSACGIAIYTVAEDFAEAKYTTNGNVDLVNCVSPFGQALSFGRGTAAANITIEMDKIGTAGDKALAFYYDVTGSKYGGNPAFSFVPTTKDGNEMCMGPQYTYYTYVDGVWAEAHPSGNFTLTVQQNTKGWIVLPLPGAESTVWHKAGGGTFYGTCQDLKKIYLEFVHFNDASIVVDQFTFASDVAMFKSLVEDETKLDGYTGIHAWTDATCAAGKTCKNCGITEGEPTGEHVWENGTCSGCGGTIYSVAEDFADIAVSGTEGAYERVTCVSPYGPALKYTRTGDNCLINIDFDEAGTAAHDAMVFYYDNTMSGYGGDAKFRIRPYTSDGTFAVLGAGYTYYTVIDGEVTEKVIDDHMNLRTPQNTAGWIILPLPQADKTWTDNGSKWDETTNDIVGMDLSYIHFANAAITLDQFGFTSDVDLFKEKVAAGLDQINGYTDVHDWAEANCSAGKTCKVCGITEGEPIGDHAWENGVCTACGAEVYTVAQGFDWFDTVSGKEGAYEQVTCVSPYGSALKYTRIDDSSLINIDFDKAGTADYDALVFYYDNTMSGFGGDAKFRMRPYTSDGTFAVLGAGYTYYTVIDGVVTEKTVDDHMNFWTPQNTAGWIILPLPQSDKTWTDGGSNWDETTNGIVGVDLI
ncbi:MAG: hypothetical protein IJO76_07740, partial [Clostridia bacterium]|nr:hypothetical protein [Clostridia bacterium]